MRSRRERIDELLKSNNELLAETRLQRVRIAELEVSIKGRMTAFDALWKDRNRADDRIRELERKLDARKRSFFAWLFS